MSTRCQVIIYKDGKAVKNFYHHYDGYPEWMGVVLDGMARVAGMISLDVNQEVENLVKLMGVEGSFEEESLDSCHGDIEFCWFLEPAERQPKAKVSYKAIGWDLKDTEGFDMRKMLRLETCGDVKEFNVKEG